MTTKKWFRKTPVKKEDMERPIDIEIDDRHEQQPETDPLSKSSEVIEESPILTYRETLYSRDSEKKSISQEKPVLKRSSWENPSAIEHNIDGMRQKHPRETMQTPNSDIESKVDKILAKKKNR